MFEPVVDGELVYIPIHGLKTMGSTVIDKIDYDLSLFAWSIDGKKGYVSRCENGKTYKLHRVVLERMLGRPLESNEFVDHINRLPNDNRRSNLRLATQQSNIWNTSKIRKIQGISTTSRFKGVSYDGHKWRAGIRINGKYHYLRYFDSELDAALAYDFFAASCRGEYATSNCFNKVRPLDVES